MLVRRCHWRFKRLFNLRSVL